MTTPLKERPLLFKPEMVQALARAAQPKTVTRRLNGLDEINRDADSFQLIEIAEEPSRGQKGQIVSVAKFLHVPSQNIYRIPCPYGKPGDRLWVREPFWIQMDSEWDEWNQTTTYYSVSLRDDHWANIHYIADDPSFEGIDRSGMHYEKKSSFFMPRWASRYARDLTGIRVERLLEITDQDAIAEGLTSLSKDGTIVKYGIPDSDGLPGSDDWGWEWQEWNQVPKLAYLQLWDKINFKTRPSHSNPWVFVLVFQ